MGVLSGGSERDTRQRGKPDVVFDYLLFHSVPGAWRSVGEMRAVLPNIEWVEHAAYLSLKQDEESAAMERARKRAARKR